MPDDDYLSFEITDGFGCVQPVRIKRRSGVTLCVECGGEFTTDNPGFGNANYLKHQNGCPNYIRRSTSIIDDEVE